MEQSPTTRNPWAWVTSLYFAEGLPYVVVMTVAGIMYKRLGISNTEIALYTSWLYLPWVIKPVWSPFVDLLGTKRFWIIATQFVTAVTLASVALTIPLPNFFQYTLAIFWLMAFSSATHDIAADGFYMLGLSDNHQAAFVGVRSTFYRFAMIAGQGLFVVLAGTIETSSGGNISFAWSITFAALAGVFVLAFLYHRFILPYPATDAKAHAVRNGNVLEDFLRTFVLFFQKSKVGTALVFLLLYRFAEAQLVKIASLFMLDSVEKGGLGLNTSDVGVVYGTVGVAALLVGGLLGGYVASRKGLKAVWWLMVLSINLPDVVYVYLSYVKPGDLLLINVAVAIEQFGYGFGFTAYLLYMIMISDGEYKTAHYAICTGFMALGMMVPGMFSGALQEYLGYQHFFAWIMLSTIPAFLVAGLVKIDPEFGKKKKATV